jgi:hypothetical protein
VNLWLLDRRRGAADSGTLQMADGGGILVPGQIIGGIQPWFAPNRALAEEITACLLHKAYQLAALEKKGLPRRFVEGDI